MTSFTFKKKKKLKAFYLHILKIMKLVEWVALILAPLLWSFISYSHLSQTWVSFVNAVLINLIIFFVFIFGIVTDCRKLLEQISSLKISHCFHGTNQCADNVARKGALKQRDFVGFNNPLLDIRFKLFWLVFFWTKFWLVNISILYYPKKKELFYPWINNEGRHEDRKFSLIFDMLVLMPFVRF